MGGTVNDLVGDERKCSDDPGGLCQSIIDQAQNAVQFGGSRDMPVHLLQSIHQTIVVNLFVGGTMRFVCWAQLVVLDNRGNDRRTIGVTHRNQSCS
jgi:hypothetical protein